MSSTETTNSAAVRAARAKQLLGIATGAESEAVRLAAIRDAPDRAGLSARTAVSVEAGAKPWEVIFDDIAGGSRAESRARRDIPDDELDDLRTPALEAARPAPAEIADEFGDAPDVTKLDAHVRAVMQKALKDLAAQRHFPILG